MSAMSEDNELTVLRRRQDDIHAAELAACKTGITGLEKSISDLRESVHVQLTALQIQIAKLPAPISLKELEERFVLRVEQKKEEDLIKKLLESFITKEEIRPLKVAIYSFWTAVALSMIGAAITLAFKS